MRERESVSYKGGRPCLSVGHCKQLKGLLHLLQLGTTGGGGAGQ